MANYEEVRVKLTINQLKKLESAAKNITGTTLRIIKKNLRDLELSHELFLTEKKTKIINALVNNTLIDIKLSKAQLSRIIQSCGFLYVLLFKFVSLLMKVTVP